MLRKRSVLAYISVVLLFAAATYGQNKFEGYSFTVEADNGGACPVKYLPSAGAGNAIDVFVAGTNMATKAPGITACDGSTLRSAANVGANNDGRWCFRGPEPMYEIRLSTGVSYLWYPMAKDTGFYNVKDFRPVTRTAGTTAKYAFTEPADYTNTIKNAVAYVAARQGGTLRFPDGDYVVGTTDGNTRDPGYEAITIPSGIVIEGASSNYSIPTTNLPLKTSASRIRLRNENQTIFRIGGCTNNVAVRTIELLGNSALYGEMPRSSTGDYGIEGLGKWAIDPMTGAQSPNSSQGIKIENVTFQNLDKGLFVHNANDGKCNAREQSCYTWQFDYVVVDHAMFINNRTGIWIDTYNTDWKIGNSFFSYVASNAPGDGIRIQKGGNILIEQSFGGGYNYGPQVGGTFIYIDTLISLTVISSASERSQRSIYTNPLGAIGSMMVNVIGSVFSDKIDLNGRLNYISSGNFYGAKTIDAEPGVTVTSVGDRNCYDSMVLPGRCTDELGRSVLSPGIVGGRRMFETGRVGEDTGPNRIQGKANYFGYNVQIGDGLLQFDPNITFTDITAWAAGSGTRPKAEDGAFLYCKDCAKNSSGVCIQGKPGVDGAFAKRINNQWRCD